MPFRNVTRQAKADVSRFAIGSIGQLRVSGKPRLYSTPFFCRCRQVHGPYQQ